MPNLRPAPWGPRNALLAFLRTSGFAAAIVLSSLSCPFNIFTSSSCDEVDCDEVWSVQVSSAGCCIIVGSTATFSATPFDRRGNPLDDDLPVTWGSSKPDIASVSSNTGKQNVVTGIAEGSATITAIIADKIGTREVTVQAIPVASVQVDPPTATVQVGGTADLTATLKDASGRELDNREITWSTSNSVIATVSLVGFTGLRARVTGVAAGNVTITATSEGKSGAAAVTVSVPTWKLDGITGNASGNWSDLAGSASGTLTASFPPEVKEGETYQLSATFSGTLTYNPGWEMTQRNIDVSICDRSGLSNVCGLAATSAQQLARGAASGSITWTGPWTVTSSFRSLTTFTLEAAGGFSIQGTSPLLVATYSKVP